MYPMADIESRGGYSRHVKLAAHLYLDERGIAYEARSFPPGTEKGAANVARALGFLERQMVKTLIFESSRGERVLVMVGGDQSAISGHLKKAIGDRNIKMARPEVVTEVTGYEIGSVPPFHWQGAGFRSFLDEALTREPILGVGAGVWGNEILMTPANLVRACQAIVVNLTDRERPVTLE
jgi:Cys-tRNA(Pro)/Cys-tRNA(Cys) deacylase